METRTEVKVELTGVHICCQGCVDAVDAALGNVEGVNSQCDMVNGTVTFTAGNTAAAREALGSLAAAGFYGHSDDQGLAMRPVGEAPPGKVNSLRVAGIHNCCGPCCDAIKGAIATVDGVTGDTAEPGATAFEVTGDFHAAALVKALNDAGFSARVK
jgi:periplasmic mercuric ion binding protein